MLKQRIEGDLHAAMKLKDAVRVGALRMVIAAIKNREIEKRSELTDEGVMTVLSALIKQRHEAADLYRKGGRAELAAKEEQEVALLQYYLPKQLSDAELESLVAQSITEAGALSAKDMGKVMKVLVAKIQGRADGKRVSETVRKKLS